MIHRRNAALVGLVGLLSALPLRAALAQDRETETITRATWVVDEIVAKNKKGLPPALLRNAYAVAIFPNIIKGGFVVGGRFGHGVVLIRKDRQWSYPIFASLGGGSFGLQAGIQSTDLVLVFKSRESLDSFFEGKDKLTIAADGSVALGPLGRHAEAGTGVALKAQYLAFSRNRGLFAGASLAGTGLAIDWRSNAYFYGRMVTPGDIILKNKISIAEPSLPAVRNLLSTMARKTQMGIETEVIEGAAPRDGSEVIIEHDGPVTLDGRPVRPAPAQPRSRTRPRVPTNPDDEPESTPGDGPDLLPLPPSGGSAMSPRTSGSSSSSTTSATKKAETPKTTTATKPKWTRRDRPTTEPNDPNFPPLEAPSTAKPSDTGSKPK